MIISSNSGDMKGDDLPHSGEIDLSKVDFPVEQFFPPNLADIDPDNIETCCN